MKNIKTANELFSELNKMDRENSILQFLVPEKGKFTLVYQNDDSSLQDEIENDGDLKKMIHESLEAYERGDAQTTSDLLKSLSKEDFQK
ncbi:hypothetical protein ACW2QC_16405 [Virgibacillus sp. FSP13]